MYASNTRILKFVKETLLQSKSHTDPQTLTVGDFHTLLSLTVRSSRLKQNRKLELTNIKNQMKLFFFLKNTKDSTISLPHETLSNTDHILGHKANLNR